MGTWTHAESNSFWPLWLPELEGLENARIMTFGYDSEYMKVWKPKNVLDIYDFGSQLANALSLHLEDHKNVSSLPILR